MPSKEKRSSWLESGLCGTCGKQPPIAGVKECNQCSEKRRRRQRIEYNSWRKAYLTKRRKRYISKGLCYRCGKEESTGGRCTTCQEKQKAYETALKNQVYLHYGCKCACCGETIEEFLTIDHINNDGAKQRKKNFAGRPFYQWIIRNNYPADLQVLCMNCNWGKRTNGVCPHKMSAPPPLI